MKLFSKSHDGGADSGVTGYFIVEIKSLFSIVVLRFSEGSREAHHSHAFNALTWWLKGFVVEEYTDGSVKYWGPSFIPKWTPRNCFHKIIAEEPSWAISFRGPWHPMWKEKKQGSVYTLTHGRKIVNDEANLANQ